MSASHDLKWSFFKTWQMTSDYLTSNQLEKMLNLKGQIQQAKYENNI